MGITLQNLFQPVNDFFMSVFGLGPESPVAFRFDKFGSVVSDADFKNPINPELGYSPELAVERFSSLVNRVPIDAGDQANIVLSANSMDDTYFFRLVAPSLPFVAEGVDAATKQAMIEAFSLLKQDAQRKWETIVSASLISPALQFHPSLATPENWYDATDNSIWTSHTIIVEEAPSPEFDPDLWKLPLNAVALAPLLKVIPLPIEPDPPPDELLLHLHELDTIPEEPVVLNAEVLEAMVMPELHAVDPDAAVDISAVELHALETEVLAHNSASAVTRIDNALITEVAPTLTNAVFVEYEDRLSALDIQDRVVISGYVGAKMPTAPVTTNRISITFEYCAVQIQRPWYLDAFVAQPSWFIPNTPKGTITDTAAANNLSWLPIGFVAIRKLDISADWSADDIATAANATEFGPFKITPDMANGRLTHSGLQVFGWMLQEMPALPPNEPPA